MFKNMKVGGVIVTSINGRMHQLILDDSNKITRSVCAELCDFIQSTSCKVIVTDITTFRALCLTCVHFDKTVVIVDYNNDLRKIDVTHAGVLYNKAIYFSNSDVLKSTLNTFSYVNEKNVLEVLLSKYKLGSILCICNIRLLAHYKEIFDVLSVITLPKITFNGVDMSACINENSDYNLLNVTKTSNGASMSVYAVV